MALKSKLLAVLVMAVLLGGGGLAREGWRWAQTRHYNQALAQGHYGQAGGFAGDHGRFAAAYALQQDGQFQDARIGYSRLEHTLDLTLRAAVLFNMGNTYLEQASTIDMRKEADRALPLVELAKASYRELLRIDSQHWDGKYNLECALQMSPDVGAQKVMELDGLRGAVRTINSADPEGALP